MQVESSRLFLLMNVRRSTEEGKGYLVSSDPTIAVSVAFCDGKMIGFADMGPADKPQSSECAELYAIYLDTAHIGKGVGQASFCTCAERARDHGFIAIMVQVLIRNSLARAFL